MHRIWTNIDNFTYSKSSNKNNNVKSLQFNEKDIIPYPIKSSKNIIPRDINLQKIFTNMLISSHELFLNYSSLISDINEENHSRKKIFKKIREYFISNLIEYKIYFKTILLFDIISIQNEKTKLLNSIEEITLGALMLSIKFNYDENKMFSMKKFLKFYGEANYTLNDIIEIERKTLKIINYYLNYTTPMCFLEFFMLNGIIYNTDNLKENEYHKIYSKLENILEKIMEESNKYLKYNFFYLACSVVSFCRQNYHLEKWPSSLKKVFSVEFCFFKNEYNAYFSLKEKEITQQIKENNYKNIYDNRNYNYYPQKDIIIHGDHNVVMLDLKSLNNSNNIKYVNNDIGQDEKGLKNNNFNIYKKNNYKTINQYNNNIININISNVSLNNIYSAKTIKNLKSNRFHYTTNNNTISEYYNKNNNKKGFTLYDGVYRKSISKSKYKNRYKNKNESRLKLSKNLEEIKEVKEFIELKPYVSPLKRKRKHYYVNKLVNNERININNNENKNIRNINIILKTEQNSDNEEINKTYKRKDYTFNQNNILTKEIINNNEYNNKFYISENKNISENNKKYLNLYQENKNNNIDQKEEEQNSNEGSNFNIDEKIVSDRGLINNKNIYSYGENCININIKKIKDGYDSNDIRKINIIDESCKSQNSTNFKCESSRIGQSYIKNKNRVNGLFYTGNKEKNINKNDINVKRNLGYTKADYKEKERIKNKKYKNENKIKYNDLIKYKLAMTYSINKRK